VRQWESSIAKSIWVDRRATSRGAAAPPRVLRRPRSTAPFTQWLTLVKRMIAVKAADAWGTAVLFAQAPIVGLLIAAVFAKVVRSTPTPETWPKIGVNMATTLFVTALAAIWFGCSSMAREIVTEWPIYRRERMVGLSIGAYVASKMTVLLGIAAIQCLLLMAIVAPTCRIDSPWIWVFTMLYAAALAGGALGLLISATLRTTEAASGILPVLLLPMIVLGGILVPLSDLPALTQPLAAAMPSRWAFEGLVVPEASLRPRIRLGGGTPSLRADPAPEVVDELDADPATDAPTSAPPAAPPTDDTTDSAMPSVFRLAGNGGSHQFLLPGRRKIAEKLEEAAAQAKQELEKAKKMLEEKAQKIQTDMRAEAERKLADAKAEFEKKSAESAAKMKEEIEAKVAEAKAAAQKESEAAAERMKAEMERRVAEAQEQARKESAAAREQVRQEVEAKTAGAKAEAKKESEETAARMRTEIEAKMEEAQATAKRQSEEAGNAAKSDVETRVKAIEAEFERKSREASERLEGKLRDMQEKLEAERAKMSESLDSVRAATEKSLVPPAGTAPSGHGASTPSDLPSGTPRPQATDRGTPRVAPAPVDMAERFFSSERWRSPTTVPLAVLLGMFGLGIAGTGLALRVRDSSGR
jgi:hypothetical protein